MIRHHHGASALAGAGAEACERQDQAGDQFPPPPHVGFVHSDGVPLLVVAKNLGTSIPGWLRSITGIRHRASSSMSAPPSPHETRTDLRLNRGRAWSIPASADISIPPLPTSSAIGRPSWMALIALARKIALLVESIRQTRRKSSSYQTQLSDDSYSEADLVIRVRHFDRSPRTRLKTFPSSEPGSRRRAANILTHLQQCELLSD
jgi:hypothetical protein